MVDVRIQRAVRAHVEELAGAIRLEDAAEVRALGFEPLEAVEYAVCVSVEAYALLFDGAVAALFGVGRLAGPDTALGGDLRRGDVWLLSSTVVNRYRKQYVRSTRLIIRWLLERYDYLEARVDARYTGALRWVRHLGFSVDEPRVYPESDAPFCHVSIRRK